jgi:ComF family protein
MLSSTLSMIGREALRIVLPSWCVVCGSDLPWRDRVSSCCASCWSSLPRIASGKCRSCAMPLIDDGICITCSADPLPVDWCDAWGEYSGGLERMLHAFKFERHDFLDGPLASLAHEVLRDLDFDAIVPVPMHWTRQRRRGYNQARLLGAALAKRIRIRCDERLLSKTRETATQSTLSRGSRAENVRGAFEALPGAQGLSLLLVDDICTTGETFRACAAELLRAGATRVCAVSVAKAT